MTGRHAVAEGMDARGAAELAGLLRRFALASSGNMPNARQEAAAVALSAIERASDDGGPSWLQPAPGMAAALAALDRLAAGPPPGAAGGRRFRRLGADGRGPSVTCRIEVSAGHGTAAHGTSGRTAGFVVEWVSAGGAPGPSAAPDEPRVVAYSDGTAALEQCRDLFQVLRAGRPAGGGGLRPVTPGEACDAMEALGYRRTA